MTDPNPGTVHTMEEEMRSAGQGVFEKHSGEAGAKRARLAPAAEDAAAPAKKATHKAKAKK